MYVNLVFAFVTVAGALTLVHNSRPQTRPRLDVPGTLAVSCGLFALVFGLSHAQTTSWGNHVTIGMLVTGVLLLALFVALEARATSPLLPLRVLADRNRSASFLSIGISGAAVFGVFLFLTYYLQDVRGFSPIATGLAFLPMSAAIMSAAILGQTKLQARFGQRPLVVTGMTLGSVGMLYLTQIGVSSSYAGDILPALVVTGVGLGLVISTSISNATLGVEPTDAGVASATVNASQQIGASVGTALLSTIAASAVTHYLAGSHHVPSLIAHATVHGYDVGFSWAAAIFAVGAIVSATLFRGRLRSAEPSADHDARIRYARPDDDAALGRLAALDSAAVPAAPVLVAELDGELRAALSLVSSEVIADPFRPTVAVVEQLRKRAASLTATGAATEDRRPATAAWRPALDAAPRGTPMRHQLQCRWLAGRSRARVEQPAPRGRHRRWLRWASGGVEARAYAGRGHTHRSTEFPPVSAAGLPGRDGRVVARGDRLSAAAHLSLAPQRADRACRGH